MRFLRGILGVAVIGAGSVTRLAGQDRLYVANQDDGTVSIVDLASHRVVETLRLEPLGFGPNAKPHHAQVSPDGQFWYLTMIGAGKVVKFDRQNRVVGLVALEVPGLMSLDAGRDRLIVGRSMSAVNPPRRLAIIRPSEMRLVDEIEVFFPRPHALIADPRGEYVYTASLGTNQLASVRLADGQSTLVDVDGEPQSLTQFAVSGDGRWLVVTAQSANRLLVYDVSDPGKPVFARAVPMAKGPFEPIFTLDGATVFVTNLDANLVSVVDVASWTVTGLIESPGFGQPHGVALGPDGAYLYISNRHQSGGAHDHDGHKATGTGTVVPICVASRTAETPIAVGHYAAGMGVRSRDGKGPPGRCR
ncbi:MAG: hypothetical protein FJ206_02765 [Gemmatimonadetes bacterium]|nr:hypothetical protein [Gemmatimonadota bacterium]